MRQSCDRSLGKRVAAVVLAYEPDPGILGRVRLIAAQADRVYVVNNSPTDAVEAVLRPVGEEPDVTVLNQSGNIGVAAGFNAGIRAALADGFEFVWIFDQDSTVAPGMLEILLSHSQDFGERTGIIGPALRAAETGRMYPAETGTGAAPRDTLISSGSLISRNILDQVGLHDEWMFIDYVDHDICLRARERGFVNLKVFDAVLNHRFGDSQPARLLGRPVYLANYSPLRLYHQTRNRIVLLRRFGPRGWALEDFAFTLKAWIKITLLEKGRRAKLCALFEGAKDGLRARR